MFCKKTGAELEENLSTVCVVDPKGAEPLVEELSFAQRELIYHETHANDSSYMAWGLYQMFFDMCQPGQKVSLQIKNEVHFLRDAFDRHKPKYWLQTLTTFSRHHFCLI
jgi:hypothetical protein